MNRVRHVCILSILGNLFLLIIKFIVGIISHSQALLADALNSFGDIFSSIMTYLGNKKTSLKSDIICNFGYGNAEYIYSFIISITMFLIAAKILVDSIQSFIFKEKFIFSIYLIILCFITLIIKLILYIYARYSYKKKQNILLYSLMKDHRNDIFVVGGTLLSIMLGSFGYYFFDGIIGIIISISIFVSAFSIFLNSYQILLGKSLSVLDQQEIKNYLFNYSFIDVKKIESINVGYQYIVILCIKMDFKYTEYLCKIEEDVMKINCKICKVYITLEEK